MTDSWLDALKKDLDAMGLVVVKKERLEAAISKAERYREALQNQLSYHRNESAHAQRCYADIKEALAEPEEKK